jgi:hypothetical protein
VQAQTKAEITPQASQTPQLEPSDKPSKDEIQIEQNSPGKKPEERLLDDSTNLLADFFNGQVIASDPHEES